MCEGYDHKDKHQHKCFYTRTHTHAQAHTPLLRCYNMLLLHTSIHAFSHKCCFTPTHTHIRLYTHKPLHTCLTHMRLRACFSTHAVAHMQHTYAYTGTLTRTLLGMRFYTSTLAHARFYTNPFIHTCCAYFLRNVVREKKNHNLAGVCEKVIITIDPRPSCGSKGLRIVTRRHQLPP